MKRVSTARMNQYGRISGESGVTAYRVEPQAIEVRFMDGKVYRYSYASTGRADIEQMKLLASAGKGLSTFISQHVRQRYESSS